MNDESLIEPFSVQEIFVDGFTEYVARDGVMTCAGYRLTSDGDKVVKVRLICEHRGRSQWRDGCAEGAAARR